ncbi:MAG: hypothetical protein ACKOAU_12665, partial [Pirellula sp.]
CRFCAITLSGVPATHPKELSAPSTPSKPRRKIFRTRTKTEAFESGLFFIPSIPLLVDAHFDSVRDLDPKNLVIGSE